MPTPNKPTKEELKAKEEEAIKAAEELEENPDLLKEEINPEEEARIEAEANTSEDSVIEEEETLQVEEEQAEPSEEEKAALRAKLEAEKKKSAASARENQKIYAKNRIINKALVDADEISEPTEEELVKEFPEWDVMSDTERIFAKETVISRNWRKTIAQAKEQATKIEKWNESVEDFISDPVTLIKNSNLEGKTEEFKIFAQEESNNSVPFKILVSAFLHEYSAGKAPNKGKMFENGSGGPNEKPQPKSDKITLEQARKLRESNYSKYKEYLIAGKIESDL